MRQQVLHLMMTILESKHAQTHVALSVPNGAANTAADDDYIRIIHGRQVLLTQKTKKC